MFHDFFLLVYYNVASAEFPSSSDQEAMQKCVSVAGLRVQIVSTSGDNIM